MKRCPTCARAYTDDSLAYCLEDGSTLLGDSSTPSALAATLINPEPRATIPAGPEVSYPNVGYSQPSPSSAYRSPSPAWMAPAAPPSTLAAASPGRGLAVAALVCAIAAFVLLGFCILSGATGVEKRLIGGIFIFSALLGLVGALLGIMALVKAGRDTNPQNSKVLHVVGLILNGVYLIIVVIFLIAGAVASEKSPDQTIAINAIFEVSRPTSFDSLDI